MVNRILQYITQHNLVSLGDKLIIALSGGPDSVCLLHLLYTMREKLGINLHAAHLNHNLRGAESEEDCRYASDLARSLDIPFTAHTVNIEQYRHNNRCSLEEAARQVRYAFLANTLTHEKAQSIATGHTRDDHVETIIMNIIRGSGLRGLRGLQPSTLILTTEKQTPVKVIRPLILLSREETEEYCRLNGLAPRQDSSNMSLNFFRNRVRHELIPCLQKYNNRIDESLLRLASISSDDYQFITEQSNSIWRQVAQEKDDSIYLDLPLLLQLPKTLQRNAMAEALSHMLGSLYDIEFSHIEAMVQLLNKPASKLIHLPEGLALVKEYNRLVLTREATSSCPFPSLEDVHTIDIPGCKTIPGWDISAEIVDCCKDVNQCAGFTALFDRDKIGKQLTVRARKPGDRFRPLGMKALKKIQDFMVDMKIPRSWRDRIPLLCSDDTIIWIVGWRIDESYKVRPSTTGIVKIKFTRAL